VTGVRRPAVVLGSLALGALLVGAFTAPWENDDGRLDAGVTEVDEPLPRLTGPTVQGGVADSLDLRGGVAIVNVWATWCGPCRREQPALQRLYERYGDRGVSFLGINYRDDEAAARAWVVEFGVSYPSIVDRSGAFADDLEFLALPDTYVVDRDGRVRYAVFGETDERELEPLIQELLAS
jgi:DsbE subfamily thiol:disulfide oxidoreductase